MNKKFTNVHKKFFTDCFQYENKEATNEFMPRSQKMLNEIKSVIARSQDTLLQDAAGAAALMVILVGGLYLPGLV